MNHVTDTAPATKQAAQPRKTSASRLRKIDTILNAAERHFALMGFEGAPLELIAQDAGFSRHNLLYYFPSKEALYEAVLESIMNEWVRRMTGLTQHGDPREQIRAYVNAKFEFAQARPFASQLFTKEMIAGAPFTRTAIRERFAPMLAANVAAFEHWAEQGLISRVNFTHLMFTIWTVTQGYVDQQAQLALLLNQDSLSPGDFASAQTLLIQMLSATLKIDLADESAP